MRATWKLKSYHNSLFRKSFVIRLRSMHSMRLRHKRLNIMLFMKEKNLRVYCGNKFLPVYIKPEMRGLKLGSFVFTKRITSEIHKKELRGRKVNVLKKKK